MHNNNSTSFRLIGQAPLWSLLQLLLAAVFGMSVLSGCNRDVRANPRVDEVSKVTQVVRNDIGELKWMIGEISVYTPAQAAGLKIFQESGCPYCHARDLSPVTGMSGPLQRVGWGYAVRAKASGQIWVE